jgi:hypothetical protein
MFAYPCPSCRQRLLAPPSRVGQRSICPKCLHPLTVPHPEQVATAGPFAPTPDPTPDEPYQPRSIFDLPEPHGETPAPMNTMPARTGEFAELERVDTLTEPFLDLPPVVADPPAPTDLEPVALLMPEAPAKPTPGHAVTGPHQTPPSSRGLPKPHDGRVMFDAAGLFGGDAVAQLSAAISMRMAPPPLPTTDRTYAVIGWVAGTLVGLGVWVLGVWQAGGWLPYVAVVGGSLAAFGLLWRAYLSGRGGSWAGGLLTLLPPVCLVQLVRPVDGYGLRPLWFVLSGLGLFGLYVVGQPVHRWVDDTFEAKKVEAPPAAPTAIDVEAVAAKLGSKADREEGRKALVRAGVSAEPAVRKLLAAKADGTVLAACDVLSEIGTAETAAALRKLADQTPSRAVRIEATTAADAIDERLRK